MKIFALALALILPAAMPAQTAASTQTLVIELTIPAPLPEVWKAFTTQQGLESWLAPNCTVDLRPGGDWLVHFPGPNGTNGSTGGGTILSFIPKHEIVLNAIAPDRFPTVRAHRTRAVFSFRAQGHQTAVRLTQTGWQSGPEWDAAYEYLAAGNAQLLAALHHRFVAGPTDWQKLMAPSETTPKK